MIRRASNWLAERANGRLILLLAGITLLFPIVVFPLFGSPSAAADSEVESLDLRFSYSPDEAYEILSSYGEAGRRLSVRSHLTADVLYPLLYGLTYSLALSYLARRLFGPEHPIGRLNLLPIAAMLADLAENTGIVVLSLRFPERLESLARLTSLLTSVKWLLAGGMLGLVAVGLVALAFQKVRSRSDAAPEKEGSG